MSLSQLIETFVLPPGALLLLLFLGLVLRAQISRRWGNFFLVSGLLLSYLTSIPATTHLLAEQMETPVFHWPVRDVQAIVVLGADRYRDAPEYGGDTISGLGLERLRYAAWLQKETQLPLLTSGGGTSPNHHYPEAVLMRNILHHEFSVPVAWVEGESKNTYENAVFSVRMLDREKIDRIILVTHMWHMPRAMEAFERAGITVIPAATKFRRADTNRPLWTQWLPNARAQFNNWFALHELVGLIWYRFNYY